MGRAYRRGALSQMRDCCAVDTRPSEGAVCPECHQRGRSVERITLKALLRSEALARLAATSYRFCPTPACGVVYFAADAVFRREDSAVPVFQKDPPCSGRTVCYCFGISEGDIQREVARTGAATASDRIAALVKADRCACEVRNPQGTCCLGNVVAAERAAGSREREEHDSVVTVR